MRTELTVKVTLEDVRRAAALCGLSITTEQASDYLSYMQEDLKAIMLESCNYVLRYTIKDFMEAEHESDN